MTEVAESEHATLEASLRRLELLTAELELVSDRKAREAARELLELMLDMHGLALARLTSLIASAANGSALLKALAADPHISAILLLHGLHPDDARTRLDRTIAERQPQWNERGFRVDVLGIDARGARVRLYKNGSSEPVQELRREVEQLLSEAVPDLDDIAVEIEIAGAVDTLGSGAAAAAIHAV